MKSISKLIVISGSLIGLNVFATQYEFKLNSDTSSPDDAEIVSADDSQDKLPEGIIYLTTSADGKTLTPLRFTRDIWADKSRSDFRRQWMEQFYFANTRSTSNSGKKHLACFTGNIDRIAQFLANNGEETHIDGVEKMLITVSADKKMAGIEYQVKFPHEKETRYRHFRIPHCTQGSKAPLISVENIQLASGDLKKITRSIASLQNAKNPDQEKSTRLPNAINDSRSASKAFPGEGIQPDGFTQFDKVDAKILTRFRTKNKRNLPQFSIRANYQEIRPNAQSYPWRGVVKNITQPGEGEKLARIILDYFLDSLVQDGKNPDNNLIAQNSPQGKSQWCHMPWLNVGESGREAIHGLTKERDMEATPIYPETQLDNFKSIGGSDWGIGYYNDVACQRLGEIFGSYDGKNIPTKEPNFKHPESLVTESGVLRNKLFPDGTVSVKVLFTTASLAALKNSYVITANTTLPKETQRSLRPMRLVQIDVAVKDSQIEGTSKDADHWIMTTFYFDENTLKNSYFANSALKSDPRFVKTSLSAFLKMRPIGIQYGFDPTTTRIFDGSVTNTSTNAYYVGNNPNLLNGPADNPTASCLSCHGAAGSSIRIVPGIKDFEHYKKLKNKGTLDFSMQLAFAKRNFETRPQMSQ